MKNRWFVYLLSLCMILSMLVGCGGSTDSNTGETKNPIGQETNADSVMNWKDQYDLGIRLLNEGRYEDAILAFTAAIQINPKSAQTYVDRANAYLAWADAAIQNAYASLGEGETLVWSDITVSTSEGDKTIGDLYKEATEDFDKADELIANGESTDTLDNETIKDATEKQAEALANLAQSLLPKKDEPDVLDQILELLDRADKLTDDEEIQKLIDAIRNEAIKPARRLPIGYRMEYENPADGTITGWTKLYYDEKGRLIGEAYVAEDGTEWPMTPIYYDANGHELPLKDVGEFVELDANGLLIAMGYTSDQMSMHFTYDAKGNLITVEDSEYGYTYRTVYKYDEENRLIQQEYYDGSTLYIMSYYVYDAEGHLIQIQDIVDYDMGNRTPSYVNYKYDDAGQLVYHEILNDNGTPLLWVSYTYNSEGELISKYFWQDPNTSYVGPYTHYYIYE